jgi:hypothetical protein
MLSALVGARAHSFVDSETFDRTFMADLHRVEACMGPALFRGRYPGHPDQSRVHHCIASVVFASFAMARLKTSGKLNPWTSDHGLVGEPLWRRLVWRLALVLPVGYIVSDHALKGDCVSWNPAIADLPTGLSMALHPSNRTVAPKPVSLATYLRLFPSDALPSDPMITFAVIDAFAERPNRDNPLADAILATARMFASEHQHLSFPYWWNSLLNDAVHGTALSTHVLSPLASTRTSIEDTRLAAPPTRDVARAAAAPPPTPVPPPSPTAVPSSVSTDAPFEPARVPAPPPAPAPAPLPAPTPTHIPPHPVAVTPPRAPPVVANSDDELIHRALQTVRHAVANALLRVNGSGATFHVLNGRLHMVAPGGVNRIADHMAAPGEAPALAPRLLAALQSGGWLDREPSGDWETRWTLRNQSRPRLVVMRLYRFSADAQAWLYPSGLRFSDNADLVPDPPSPPTRLAIGPTRA